MAEGPHKELLLEALRVEAGAQEALLRGADAEAARALRRAADLYRQSWEVAPPRSYGRLIGMLKAAVLAGDAGEDARFAGGEIGEPPADSPAAHYAVAIAALVLGDDAAAAQAADGMRGGSPAFVRTADAIAALAQGDAEAYGAAVQAIVADFETREDHLTGVAIADTALMLERLAQPRGLACRPASALLPAP